MSSWKTCDKNIARSTIIIIIKIYITSITVDLCVHNKLILDNKNDKKAKWYWRGGFLREWLSIFPCVEQAVKATYLVWIWIAPIRLTFIRSPSVCSLIGQDYIDYNARVALKKPPLCCNTRSILRHLKGVWHTSRVKTLWWLYCPEPIAFVLN